MDQRFRRSTFAGSRDHDEPQSSSETGGDDSPLSGDDTRATATTATTTALSPKKGRRSIQKRVVTIPFGDVDGSRSGKGEAYPPSDSWAWRKYGQKPIKGSPYPRGYYRCSSSKGCPARKQVERSRVDPTTLIITYASEHNHPAPATKHHHHHNHHQSSAAAPATPISPATPTPPSDDVDTDAATCTEEFPSEERKELLACAAELGLGGAVIMDFSWLSDVVKEAPSFVGPSWDDDDADVSGLSMTSNTTVNMREEDVSLFADLDELPECSAVFRTRRGTSTCTLRPAAAASLCGTTG